MSYRKEQTLMMYPDNVKLCRTGKNRLLTLYPDNVKQWRTGKNRLLTLYPDKEKYLKQRRLMVLSDGIRNYLELQWKRLKSIWNELELQRKKRNKDMKLPWEETAHVFTLLRGRELGGAPAIPDFLKVRAVNGVDTMFWPAEKRLKAVKLNGAFWRGLRPMLDHF